MVFRMQASLVYTITLRTVDTATVNAHMSQYVLHLSEILVAEIKSGQV